MTMPPYPNLNGSAISSDLGQLLVYADSVTGGMTALMVVMGFFLLVFVSSMLWSYRTSGRIKLELHFAAASLSTLGWTVILSTIQGFNVGMYLIMAICMTIAAVLWIFLSNPNENY